MGFDIFGTISIDVKILWACPIPPPWGKPLADALHLNPGLSLMLTQLRTTGPADVRRTVYVVSHG